MILDSNSIIFEILILMFVNVFYIHVFFLSLENYFEKNMLIKNDFKVYIYSCFISVISVINMIEMKYFFACLVLFLVMLYIFFERKVGLRVTIKLLNLFCFVTIIFNLILRFLYKFYNVNQAIFIKQLCVVIIIPILLKIFVWNLFKLIRKYFDFFKYSKSLKNIYLITFILITLFVSFVIGFIYKMNYCEANIIVNVLMFMFVVNLVIIFNLMIIVLYLNSSRRIVSNAKIKTNYYNELMFQFKKYIDDAKKIRHDFGNHMLAISSLVKDESYEELSNYIKKVFNEGKFIVNKLVVTGNPIMDVIINNKLNKSMDLNIKVDKNIYVSQGLKIDEFDLVVVLGNILDNAIEATSKLKESERYIKIFIRYNDRKTLIISVLNTYDGKNNFLTTRTSKKDKDNHGIGLKNVREVIDNNNGFFELSHDGNIFEVKIMFYDVEQDENKKV